jgi:hypothetical protein
MQTYLSLKKKLWGWGQGGMGGRCEKYDIKLEAHMLYEECLSSYVNRKEA